MFAEPIAPAKEMRGAGRRTLATEIVDQLEAALEEFRGIEETLGAE